MGKRREDKVGGWKGFLLVIRLNTYRKEKLTKRNKVYIVWIYYVTNQKNWVIFNTRQYTLDDSKIKWVVI